jgi:hypothetical protein
LPSGVTATPVGVPSTVPPTSANAFVARSILVTVPPPLATYAAVPSGVMATPCELVPLKSIGVAGVFEATSIGVSVLSVPTT